MSAKKSQRITIKAHNIKFLESLGAQMGITDLSEVLNYLLLDCKGLLYSFGNKSAPTPQQAPIGYNFDVSSFEKAALIPECDHNYIKDPIITRLATLIEDF